MKGLIAVASLAVLAGCAGWNPLASAPAASDNWTDWVCDSQATVHWRFADAARRRAHHRTTLCSHLSIAIESIDLSALFFSDVAFKRNTTVAITNNNQ